jgi:uncharacterized protein YpuA (DUF1002 family)
MENLNVILEEFTTSIDSGFPSVYSKEDVKVLLGMFAKKAEVTVQPKDEGLAVTECAIDDLMEDIVNAFEYELDDTRYNEFIDLSSAEFSIDYGNQLILDSIDLATRQITEKLSEVIANKVSDFIRNLSKDNSDEPSETVTE